MQSHARREPSSPAHVLRDQEQRRLCNSISSSTYCVHRLSPGPHHKETNCLWDDIRFAFSGALHVRNQARVLPFLKGTDFMLLMPLRIAAIPDVTLDVVIDDSVQQTFPEKKSKTLTIVNAMQEDLTTKHANATSINTPRRNPVYGLEEMAMDNYSHIDNPAVDHNQERPNIPQACNRNLLATQQAIKRET
ncbi:MAG: hypothetical protein JOS17DRAFT_536798 [Linnemannia elongata]|nr:MAG: hypothetical protein JOS17DRAFT_536798 [Linnemannia elongata]